MTHAWKITVIVVAFIAIALLPAPVQAQGADTLKIAIIDINAIQSKAAVVRDIGLQLQKYRKAFQEEIQKEEVALRTANQELSRQRTILSPEAYAEERRKFNKRLEDVQRTVQKRKSSLANVQRQSMAKVQTELNKIINALANERKLTLILRRHQTVLAAQTLVITQVILERINKQITTLKVPDPEK